MSTAALPAKRRRRPGQPSKRTPRTARLICKLVSDGLPIGKAASVAGLSNSWLCQWRNEDPAFEAQIQQAIAKGIQRRLAVVMSSMESQDESIALRSATWWLTHTPESAKYFSEASRLELSGVDGGPLAQIAIVLQWPHQQPLNQSLNQHHDTDHHIADAAPGAD